MLGGGDGGSTDQHELLPLPGSLVPECTGLVCGMVYIGNSRRLCMSAGGRRDVRDSHSRRESRRAGQNSKPTQHGSRDTAHHEPPHTDHQNSPNPRTW